MSDYGDEIIIKRVVSDNENAPALRAEITIGGRKYKAGLWLWTRKDGSFVFDKAENKQYKGKVELDDYQAPSGPRRATAVGLRPVAALDSPTDEGGPEDDFTDDDIPF